MTVFTKILKKPITSAIVAIIIGFFVAAIVLGVAGFNPIEAFAALFQGALGRPNYISNVIIKATPLCCVALVFHLPIKRVFSTLVLRVSTLWAPYLP